MAPEWARRRSPWTGRTASASTFRVGLLDAQKAHDLLAARLGRSRVDAEPAAAADIVRACGRLPQALAVVAARASFHESVPLAAVAADLASAPAMRPLDAGDPAEDFRAVLSWSYQTLDQDAAAAFRATALHPAGVVDRHAVAALVELPLDRARTALGSLERAGLATQEAPGRFTVHDLIKQYAQELSEQLEPAAVRTAALIRLAAHLAGEAQDAVAHFDGGGVPGNEGLRAAELCERATAVLSGAGDPAGTAAALDTLGEAHAQLGEREPARSYYEQALAVFGRLGVPVVEAETLMRLGDLHHDDGDTTAARVCWSRGLDTLDRPALAESPVAADLRRRMSR